MKPQFFAFCLLSALVPAAFAADPLASRLVPQVQVHGDGIYLNQVLENPLAPLPHVLLAPAPAPGQAIVLNRAQLTELVRQAAPELISTNWAGTQVRVTRRMRLLEEAEVKDLLTTSLQREFVKDRGEVELRFTRPWAPVSIADEPFVVQLLDLPSAGVTGSFILRFELRAGTQLLGNWQIPLQARIWREIWVAGSPLLRGQQLKTADVIRQRRDLLAVRDPLAFLNTEDPSLELAENVPAGMPLTSRSVRHRPIVKRGRMVEALFQDGAMIISTKAEVLEDGLPGQIVRARNLKSKREFRGKVQSEETILVAF